jgi:hypothetical protein
VVAAAAIIGDAVTQDPLLDWLSKAGVIGILAAAVVSFQRGWIVSGRSHERVCEERDRALELVYRHAELAERAIAAVEKTR